MAKNVEQTSTESKVSAKAKAATAIAEEMLGNYGIQVKAYISDGELMKVNEFEWENTRESLLERNALQILHAAVRVRLLQNKRDDIYIKFDPEAKAKRAKQRKLERYLEKIAELEKELENSDD